MNRFANLIPVYRIEARRRRALLGRWTGGGALMLMLLLAAAGWLQTRSPGNRLLLEQQVQRVEKEIETVTGQRDSLKASVASARRIDAANKAMRRHPDWSQLLVLLGQLMDEDLALRECKLAPRDSASGLGGVGGLRQISQVIKPDEAADAGVFELHLEGYARTQSSVSTFLLRLESTGLFSKVELEQMRKEPLGNQRLHTFEVRCSFGQPSGEDEGKSRIVEVQP